MAASTVSPLVPGRRPLLVTGDSTLLDAVLGVAASVGIDLDVTHDPPAVRQYESAPLVMIGTDAIGPVVRRRLPHRQGTLLVGLRESIGELPVEMGALHTEDILTLPDAGDWLAEWLSTSVLPVANATARVVTVMGGRGGAGASVLVAALAVTAARSDRKVLLIDGDPFGGGVDLVLGWETVVGLRWPELSTADGAVDPGALLEVLPSRGPLAVLSCDRRYLDGVPAQAMRSALEAGGSVRDLVVVDLPRHLSEAAVVALRAAHHALVVVPAEIRACMAAGRIVAAAGQYTEELRVVVRGPGPANLRRDEICRSLRLPLAGVLRTDRQLPRQLELGQPPAVSGDGPLAGLCRELLDSVGLPVHKGDGAGL